MEQDSTRREQKSYFSWNQRNRRGEHYSQTPQNKKLKIVLDTNILISGTYWFGNPKTIIELAITNKIQVFTSIELINEYKNILVREFLETEKSAENKTRLILDFSNLIKPITKVSICIDPDDNKVLEIALEVRADIIVSGDKHLLSLKKFEEIQILTAKKFIELFEKEYL